SHIELGPTSQARRQRNLDPAHRLHRRQQQADQDALLARLAAASRSGKLKGNVVATLGQVAAQQQAAVASLTARPCPAGPVQVAETSPNPPTESACFEKTAGLCRRFPSGSDCGADPPVQPPAKASRTSFELRFVRSSNTF